jgi:phosphatidylserine decarboxylase
MSVLESIQKQLVPIHKQGYVFIAVFLVATLILGWIYAPLGWIGLILTVWCAYFFRDPVRQTPLDEGLVIAPADGVIVSVDLVAPPPELGLGGDPTQRISIFMSIFDCHINRAPMSGRIAKIVYKPGLFLNADLDKASEDNERNGFIIETLAGRVGVVQIAGLIARRIVAFAEIGDRVGAGDRIGMIRFGSRVDVFLPPTGRPLISVGTRTVAGETIIADFHADAPRRQFKAS